MEEYRERGWLLAEPRAENPGPALAAWELGRSGFSEVSHEWGGQVYYSVYLYTEFPGSQFFLLIS